MPKYKLREGRVALKASLCLFLLSKIKSKAHGGSSRTAVRFFVCSGGDNNEQFNRKLNLNRKEKLNEKT